MQYKLILIFLFLNRVVFSQVFQGSTLSISDKMPISFVNIGILGKNIGTVSDENGRFKLSLSNALLDDTVKVSCIGFKYKLLSVSSLLDKNSIDVFLEENKIDLPPLTVNPRNYKFKKLGVDTRNKSIQVGFGKDLLGREIGVLIKNKKTAILESVFINFAECTYDSIFFRVNVYEYLSKNEIINALNQPIYLSISKKEALNRVEIDVKKYNILVNGDFLVSIEHIKDLGEGTLMFSSKFGGQSFGRATSQSEWGNAPIRVSIGVQALVEQ